MKCPNCGNEVQGKFCTNCGTRMDPAQGGAAQPADLRDSSATAAISPEDLQELAAHDAAFRQTGETPPGQGPMVDPSATVAFRPSDMQGFGAPGQGPAAPNMGPGSRPLSDVPPPGARSGAGQYGGPAQGAPPSSGQYGSPAQGVPPGAGPYGGPPPGGPYGGPGAGMPTGGPSEPTWAGSGGPAYGGAPGRFGQAQAMLGRVPVPPAIQNALKPLEGAGKQILAWAGAALLLIGTFLPTKTLSYSTGIFTGSGSGNLWDWSNFLWPLLLIILALLTAGLAFIRDYQWLLVTGALALLILIVQFLWTFSVGVDIPGLSAHPSWGWIILLVGALLILAAALTRPTARDAQDDNGVTRLLGGIGSGGGARAR